MPVQRISTTDETMRNAGRDHEAGLRFASPDAIAADDRTAADGSDVPAPATTAANIAKPFLTALQQDFERWRANMLIATMIMIASNRVQSMTTLNMFQSGCFLAGDPPDDYDIH